jgi:hypothetical protein
VLPKFRNPDQPSETWAGRGKKPRWLTKQLRAGPRLDDFRIEPSRGVSWVAEHCREFGFGKMAIVGQQTNT